MDGKFIRGRALADIKRRHQTARNQRKAADGGNSTAADTKDKGAGNADSKKSATQKYAGDYVILREPVTKNGATEDRIKQAVEKVWPYIVAARDIQAWASSESWGTSGAEVLRLGEEELDRAMAGLSGTEQRVVRERLAAKGNPDECRL